eukprot:1156591-Pelagomonas_calceolata.AAC.4
MGHLGDASGLQVMGTEKITSGTKNTPYIDEGKGDTLAQRAMSLLCQRERGKQVWVWWVAGRARGKVLPRRIGGGRILARRRTADNNPPDPHRLFPLGS